MIKLRYAIAAVIAQGMIGLLIFFWGTSRVCGQVLNPPPQVPDDPPIIQIVGDRIARSLGVAICEMIELHDLAYDCQISARNYIIGSDAIASLVNPQADIVVMSMCMHDEQPETCARYITVARQRAKPSATFIWIVPVTPSWAPDMIRRAALGFVDQAIDFEPGCCTQRKREAPADVERLAHDTMLLVISR